MSTHYGKATELATIATMAAVLAACQPAHNWRQITPNDSLANAQLPCKPERIVRPVVFDQHALELQMTGCKTGSTTWALMTTTLPANASVDEVLAGWQRATLDNMHADAATIQRRPFQPRGAMTTEHSQRLDARGRGPDNQPIQAQAAWAAHADDNGQLELLHAVAYTQASHVQDDNAMTEFFDAIAWPGRTTR